MEIEHTYFATDLYDNPIMLGAGEKRTYQFKGKMQDVSEYSSVDDLKRDLEDAEIFFYKLWLIEFSYRTYRSHYGTTETSHESLGIHQISQESTDNETIIGGR